MADLKTIPNVESIQEPDLSPLILSEFRYQDRLLKLKKPITLEPFQDESKQLLCLNYDELGIDIFADTRDELDKELIDHMEFLWRVYAQGNESKMTQGAAILSRKLREMIQEEPIHA